MIFKVIATLIIFLLHTNAYSTETTNDFWYGMFTKKKMSDQYSWWAEAQLRYDVDESRMQQTLFRTGLLRSTERYGGFGLLYAYIEARENKEHRFTLQHTAKYGSLTSFLASHRMRLELRTREDQARLAERFRYLIRFQKDSEATSVPVIWNELFVNLRNEPATGDRLIERNRLFIGYRFKRPNNFNIEVGYLNQYVPRTVDIMEHTLVLYLFF